MVSHEKSGGETRTVLAIRYSGPPAGLVSGGLFNWGCWFRKRRLAMLMEIWTMAATPLGGLPMACSFDDFFSKSQAASLIPIRLSSPPVRVARVARHPHRPGQDASGRSGVAVAAAIRREGLSGQNTAAAGLLSPNESSR